MKTQERDSVCSGIVVCPASDFAETPSAETGTSSKKFCSRSVSDQDGGHDKDFAQVSVPSAPT